MGLFCFIDRDKAANFQHFHPKKQTFLKKKPSTRNSRNFLAT